MWARQARFSLSVNLNNPDRGRCETFHDLKQWCMMFSHCDFSPVMTKSQTNYENEIEPTLCIWRLWFFGLVDSLFFHISPIESCHIHTDKKITGGHYCPETFLLFFHIGFSCYCYTSMNVAFVCEKQWAISVSRLSNGETGFSTVLTLLELIMFHLLNQSSSSHAQWLSIKSLYVAIAFLTWFMCTPL